MYMELELNWVIAVKPCDLKSGLHIKRALLTKLLADFDKLKCSEKHGLYICVTTLEGISEGRIWESKGCVAYNVRFRCLTYMPQKYERLFVVVSKEPLTERGFMCTGPIDNMFLSTKRKGYDYRYVPQSDTKPAHFKGKNGAIIENGSVLRVQIDGIKWNSLKRQFEAVVSTAGDYLGLDTRRMWEDKCPIPPDSPVGGATWGFEERVNSAAADAGWDAVPVKDNAGWDAAPVKESGGWGDASPAKESGGWDAATENSGEVEAAFAKTSKRSGGWQETETQMTEAWGTPPAEKADSEEGWGDPKASKPKSSVDLGTTASAKKNDDKWSSPTHGGKEDCAGAWGDGSPAKKSKGGAWDSTPSEKDNSDVGAWDAIPTTNKTLGGWDTNEVENTGGGWGD